MQGNPAWLTAISILAPVVASFGVLWLSSRHQARLIRAQHDLALEQDKIAAVVLKAEELYLDNQKWKRRMEKMSYDYMIYFRSSRSSEEFIQKINDNLLDSDFDLVRLELNLKSYFSELEPEFREAHKLVYAAGSIEARMIGAFDQDIKSKKQINSELLAAQEKAGAALDAFSAKLTERIHELMDIKQR